MSSNNSKGHEKEGDLCFHIKLTSTHVHNANHQRLRPIGFHFSGLSRKRWGLACGKKPGGSISKVILPHPWFGPTEGEFVRKKKKRSNRPCTLMMAPSLSCFPRGSHFWLKKDLIQNAHSFIRKMGWSCRIPICFVFWTSFWWSGDQNTMIMIGNRTTCSSFWVMICI